jgi:crotonobetainyl-CoA:carnitine CoA-transferase CaiB-like acyl-CoA transferase
MPIKTFSEACEDPEILAREMILDVEHPRVGKIKQINSPLKFSRTPVQFRNFAPELGQDCDQILKGLNFTEEQIKSFKKKGFFR